MEGRDYTKLGTAYKMLSEIDTVRTKRVLSLLSKDGEMTVKGIACTLRLDQGYTSQSLMILRRHNLVKFEKEGSFVYYSVNWERINQLNEAFAKLSQAPKPQLVNGL